MAKITHNTSMPDDGLGDALRKAFTDVNSNTTELYDNKVDKVSGKDLSDNNYSDTDKAKVDNINPNAEQNVQANWNELDPTSDAFILGKPIFQNSDIRASAIWIEDLKFNVTADAFPINGISYPANPNPELVLDPSSPILDRIDLIVAIKPVAPLTVGEVGFIKGELATPELVVPPDYDPSMYYVIKQIIVKAASTQPEGVSTTQVYNEGSEWNFLTTANISETENDPSVGVKSLEAVNNIETDSVTFTAPSPISTEMLSLVTFDFKLKSNEAIGKTIFIEIFLGGVRLLKYGISSGQNRYFDEDLEYQTISIDRSDLNLPITSFDQIRINPFFASTGYFIDNVVIHTGSGSETVPQSGIPEAPIDDGIYGRRNEAWEQIPEGSNIVNETLNSLSSGWITPPVMSINADPTKYDISAGLGYIVNRYVDPENPVLVPIIFNAQTGLSPTNIATSPVTYVSVDNSGNISESTSIANAADRREKINVGQLGHSDNINIIGIAQTPDLFIAPIDLIRDMLEFIGILSTGNDISANGNNLSIDKATGALMAEGLNSKLPNLSPNIKPFPAQIAANIRRLTQGGSSNTGSTFLDVGNYDLNDVLTPLMANKFTNQRVYLLTNGNLVVQYGQFIYNSMSDAFSAALTEDFIVLENLKENAKLLSIISVKSNGTDLSNESDAKFTSILGTGASSGGASIANTDALPEGVNNLYYTAERVRLVLSDAALKTTPVDADTFNLLDSAASFVVKKLSWSNIKTTLKVYFQNIFAPISRILVNATVTGAQVIDYSLYETFDFTLTGATTLSESNLPTSGSNTKVITLYVIGDFALTYPANWSTYISGAYDGTVLNTIVVEYISTGKYKVQISQPD